MTGKPEIESRRARRATSRLLGLEARFWTGWRPNIWGSLIKPFAGPVITAGMERHVDIVTMRRNYGCSHGPLPLTTVV